MHSVKNQQNINNIWIPSKEESNKRKEILRFFRDRKWERHLDYSSKEVYIDSVFKWDYSLINKNIPHIYIRILYCANLYHVIIYHKNTVLLNTTFTYIQKVDLTQCIQECCFDKLL